ncbi:Rieske (2Fe-2S) protein [Brevibacterium casei]|uniref:Cytochrome bc1 complex Rieske iron-sulfur subunit n=2 Tax=Brevibacterium casei TaxID=33889 RepID=A0A2H1HKM1_9MICO|nr:Rieske (2Fe-2S) protein [Brevibacterium casei]QPR38731.1 Rieske (2Fe-2S) protein [Brevibacterium casei]QPR42896.1 Rieske (2Fe-2S) protein [Brevibacterium casei]SMX63483.1 Ferredoxin subunit of nitrite reductase or a ring-hydroxylating dioxygenase [Brevibacterium casei CIP 102111]VEW14988.1 Cytochrome b6-f complex iron-sulfur subunit [Brevibacterium casei]
MEASRRTIITSAGAVGTVGLISACGTDDADSGSTKSGNGSSEPTAGGATIPSGDVPVGSGTVVDETYVVTQPKEGEFYAFSSVCTHQGCQVRTVTEDKITCPCHSSQFSTTTGEVLAGPATEPLPKYEVSESGGDLTISGK